MPSTPVTITAAELHLLREAARERDALLSAFTRVNGELRVKTVECDLLLERLKAFQRKLFASTSEARGCEQTDLFLNEAEAIAPTDATLPAKEDGDDEIAVSGHKRKKRGGRKPLDPALPRVVVRHELPEVERVCPHDGSVLVEIGVEVSEQLDIIPQQVRVIQHQRVKYACLRCDQGIRRTPAPARIIPKGLFTEAALAWIIVSKYVDGLPLYRLAALLRRFGGDISRNTLAASVVRVGIAVQPIINLLRDCLLSSEIIHGDETTLQVLKEAGRTAQTRSYLWAQMNASGPPIRLFTYAPGRGGAQAVTPATMSLPNSKHTSELAQPPTPVGSFPSATLACRRSIVRQPARGGESAKWRKPLRLRGPALTRAELENGACWGCLTLGHPLATPS